MSVRPGTAVALFVLGHVVVWTLLPTLLFTNAPIDVIENLAWGHEWQLGYHKHPPLQAWLCEIATTLTGQQAWGVYLAAQLLVAIAFWGAWRMARDVTDPLRAALAVIGLEAISFYTYTTPNLNANVLQLPFWALGAWLFWRAYRTARVPAWALCGAVLGLAALGKYFIVVLLVAMGIFFVLDREGRRQLRTPGPYVGAVACLLVMSPHLLWLARNEFVAVGHAMERTQAAADVAARVVRPIQFAVGQLGPTGLLLLAFVFVFGLRGFLRGGAWSSFADAPTRRYLLIVCFGPYVMLVVLAGVLGGHLRTMWGTPMWGLLPLVLLVRQPEITRRHVHRFAGALALVAVVWIVAFCTQYLLLPDAAGRAKRVHFPGSDLAAAVTDGFRELTGRPLAFVAGESWYAGNVGFYSPDRPSVFLEADDAMSPWIDDDAIRRAGAALVWPLHDGDDGTRVPFQLHRRLRGAVPQPPITLAWRRSPGAPAIRMGWAVFDPALAERLAAENAERLRQERKARRRAERRALQQPRAPVGWNVTTP